MTDTTISFNTTPKPLALTELPICRLCGRDSRLYGIEPHPRLARTDLNTYGCDPCGTTEVIILPR